MNKYGLLGMMSLLLVACHGHNQPVSVVKAEDHSAVAPMRTFSQNELPTNMPSNVTAICRDGSYSTAVENVCAGRGGIATVVHRFHAE